MFGTTLEAGDVHSLIRGLQREKFLLAAPLLRLMNEPFDTEKSFQNFARFLIAPAWNLHIVQKQLHGLLSSAANRQLNKLASTAELFTKENTGLVFYTMEDRRGRTMLCAVASDMTAQLRSFLWSQERPAILTSGTLAVGTDFHHFKEEPGLLADGRVTESVSASPFDYKANCLLYLPNARPLLTAKPREAGLPRMRGVRKRTQFSPQAETEWSELYNEQAAEIAALLDACWGHALVLFTSYAHVRHQGTAGGHGPALGGLHPGP